jgi:G3E family GTPase
VPRARKQPIPVTLVVGPRGAGKTTLINRLLATKDFADTAVILNDFGEVMPKGGRVETAADGYIALGSGCVCCTVRGALTDGLENLLRDLDNGRVAAIRRVVIEADEAADPGAVVAGLVRHPYLSLRYEMDCIVAVVDTLTLDKTYAESADAVRQVAMADVIALSRVGPALPSLGAVTTARIVDASTAEPGDIIGHGAFDPATGDVDRWLAVPPQAVPGKGEAGRIHVFGVERSGSMPLAAIDRFLEYLWALQAANIMRLRGAVAASETETVIVEGLGGFFYPPALAEMTEASAAGIRFQVVGRDLDRRLFEGYLDAFRNEAQVDMPDREALTANPLAIAGFSARRGK